MCRTYPLSRVLPYFFQINLRPAAWLLTWRDAFRGIRQIDGVGLIIQVVIDVKIIVRRLGCRTFKGIEKHRLSLSFSLVFVVVVVVILRSWS